MASGPEDYEAMSDAALLDRLRQARRASQLAAEPHVAEMGKLAAFLHDSRGWSWPKIGREMDVNASTAWRWASPYLRD